MFLMRFRCEDSLEEPTTVGDLANVANLLESRHSSPHNRELVQSIHDLFDSDRARVTGVDDAFVITDRDKDTSVIED